MFLTWELDVHNEYFRDTINLEPCYLPTAGGGERTLAHSESEMQEEFELN